MYRCSCLTVSRALISAHLVDQERADVKLDVERSVHDEQLPLVGSTQHQEGPEKEIPTLKLGVLVAGVRLGDPSYYH